VVYRGRHVVSDRLVAIKILHERGARQKDVVGQFIGEARATSCIRHTNVIDVLDFGTTPEGTVFLVMEYLEGESLRNRLNLVSHLPLFEAINILRQVARGLGAAHAAGIVHGGLKPADIFLCRRAGRRRIVRRSKAHGMRLVVEPEENFDLVKLLDFGMARFLDLAPGAQAPAGSVSGTLHYLSPEQAQGQPADQRSDIYGLGAVFYEMVTGAVPFGGESLLDILRGHVSGQVIAPSRRTPGAGIHMRIDALILRCLKKNPTLRFASTGELCEALDECVTDCAFLRDAHRLPGITESGIDLSEASREARQDPAQSVTKPAVAPVAQQPAAAPVSAKHAVVPVAAKPVVATVARKTARPPLANDPVAAVITPPPTLVATPHEPVAALITPPPAAVAADLPAEISAGFDDQPSLLTLVRSESISPDVDERPEPFDLEAGSPRLRVIALAGLLLLGGIGVAVWAARSGSAARTTKPVVASRMVPAPTPAPSPPPQAAAPVAPAAPEAALPRPEPAEPAELTGPTARGVGELASSQSRPTQASRARRTARAIPVSPKTAPALSAKFESAPAPAAESEMTLPPAAQPRPWPATEAPAPRTAAKPEPTPPAPASVDDLVREAQHAWMAGHYAAAISKAQSALKADPSPAQAVQVYELVATCSCAMGRADDAREAASHLSDTKRELVKARCMKNGVTIE
jgi:serine/threonine-protein kinase